MHSLREVVDRLTRCHPSLSPQVRKAAAYVLDNPGNVATLSMRKVAAAAEVPPPTMPRLSQALGFDTYDSFREVYRRQLQQQGLGYSEQASRLQEGHHGDGMGALWSAFRQASLANVEHLFASLDHRIVGEVAEKLIAARTVYIAGMQASHPFANYLHYVGSMAHPDWVLVRNQNGVLADEVVNLGSEDALVGISTRFYARDTIGLARMARERGATIIAITDSRTSPLAAMADIVLVVPIQSPQFFDSYVSVTALLETLVGFVVAKGDQDVLANIERVERCRRELGEYWDSAAPEQESS